MGIDWTLLAQVRDRHKTVARQHVLRERHAADASNAQLHEAQAVLQAQVDARRQLWQGTAQPQGFSVADLRSASAWDGALNARIAQAQTGVQSAKGQAAAQQARLAESRRALRAASSELDKAERMGERVQREQQRQREALLEEAADEVAVQRWLKPQPAAKA